MSAATSIQWTDKTWNPVRGCSVVSPGCVNCYAMKQAHRFSAPGKPYNGLTKQTKVGPQWTGIVRPVEAALVEPLSWRTPCRVFVNSMSDLFHEDVPDGFIDRVFAVLALANQHTFQILTKRAHRMHDYMSAHDIGIRWLGSLYTNFGSRREADDMAYQEADAVKWARSGLDNVWLGVSAEDQQRADERIPLLLQTPAAVRFVSAEPLLGPINLSEIRVGGTGEEWDPYLTADALRRPPIFGPHLDWLIVGGESGHGARPCDLAWVRSIVEQCRVAGVACFVKQVGLHAYDSSIDGRAVNYLTHSVGVSDARVYLRKRDSKGGEPSEWPNDLRVREFPETVTDGRAHL